MFLNPLATLFQHVVDDVVAFDLLDIVFEFLFSVVEHDHMVLLELLPVESSLFHLADGVVLSELGGGLRLALHT